MRSPTVRALPVARQPRALAFAATLAAIGLLGLAGCASQPSENISLIPSDQVDARTRADGVFTQPVKWERSKPGCSGECPSLAVDSLVFPGMRDLTVLVDHALATMTGIGESTPRPYRTIAEYEAYFWQTAAPRDSAVLAAKTRYRNKHLTVLELDTWQYFTGAAHGIPATQFLNWDNGASRVLPLDDVLRPGGYPAYVQALREVHAAWLARHPDAEADPEGFRRLWPFQESRNFALTDLGMVVKYDAYQIAPYSSGQPELLIPYARLTQALRPAFIPAPGQSAN